MKTNRINTVKEMHIYQVVTIALLGVFIIGAYALQQKNKECEALKQQKEWLLKNSEPKEYGDSLRKRIAHYQLIKHQEDSIIHRFEKRRK